MPDLQRAPRRIVGICRDVRQKKEKSVRNSSPELPVLKLPPVVIRMAVENTSEAEERKSVISEGVSDLITSLKSLDIQHPSKENVKNLEDTFSKITLDSKDEDTNISISLRKEETADELNEKDTVKREDVKDDDREKTEYETESQDSESSPKESEDESSDDETEEEKEIKKDEKDNLKEEKTDEESQTAKDNDAESDDESESEEDTDDENYTEQVVVIQKKTNKMRGPCTRGPGVQPMSPYMMMYPGQSYGFDNQGMQPNLYTSQHLQQQINCTPYESPPYASSPGYQLNCLPDHLENQIDMPSHGPFMSSPADSYLSSPQSNGGYYQGNLASPDIGVNQGHFNLPDSPNSYSSDDIESPQMLSPAIQPPCGELISDEQGHSVSEVLAALIIVANKPPTWMPPEDLADITKNLESGKPASYVADIEGIAELAHYPNDMDINEITAQYRSLYASMTAQKILTKGLNKEKYMHLIQMMASMTNEDILKKDEDGDTPIMIVCISMSSPDSRERLVAAIERAKSINVCCEMPVNPVQKTCKNCYNSDPNSFYSALAVKNEIGDTVLSAVMKLDYPELTVKYICENLMARSSDILQVFDEKSVPFFQSRAEAYPAIKNLLQLSYQMRNSVYFEPWNNTCQK